MKATITTTGVYYGEEAKAKLETLGITFGLLEESEGLQFGGKTKPTWGRDAPASLEIATLEELVALVREHGECVVNVTDAGELLIEIYDDYRE